MLLLDQLAGVRQIGHQLVALGVQVRVDVVRDLPYGCGHLAKRRLVLGIGEEAVVGERLEKGDQVGFLGLRQGEAGDQGEVSGDRWPARADWPPAA